MNDQDSNVDGGKKENGKNAGSIEPDARLTESNNSVIDQSKIEMVFNEDTLWKSLALRKLDRGFEGKQAVAGSYIELASFYERAGGYEAAAKFVKNALAIVDDTDLKLYLARLQGRSRGVDFIVSFNDVLKDSQYNLKLALEFCYFLEIKGYHDAAIDILETELRKRLRVNASDASEAATINGFLTLLQIQIDVDSTIRMEHYKELFSENFPSEIIVDVNIINYTPFATIVEQDLVEYEEQWGAFEEAKHYGVLILFFLQHYTFSICVIISAIFFIVCAVFRVRSDTIELVGTTLVLILLSFIMFELLRSYRLQKSARVRSHMRISQNSATACLIMTIINVLSVRIFNSGQFFSPFAVKTMSAVLVLSVIWRTYLSLETLNRILKGIGSSIVTMVNRRSYRRQLAGLVAGTSKWIVVLWWSLLLAEMAKLPVFGAFVAFLQTAFLCVCWRWGYLEMRAEKQKLRDTLAFSMPICIAAIAAIQIVDGQALLQVLLGFSVDGVLLTAVIMTYALQLGWISKWFINVSGVICIFFNFLPVIKPLFVFASSGLLIAQNIHDFQLTVVVALSLILCLTLSLVFRSRATTIHSTVHQESYMESKYKFTNSQVIGAGDNANVSDNEQTNNVNYGVDLKKLAVELASIRVKMAELAVQPDHFRALNEITLAENAANLGNEYDALAHLKSAGVWFWNGATQIGIGVATAAAKHLVGF